jgi:hypothetical protein
MATKTNLFKAAKDKGTTAKAKSDKDVVIIKDSEFHKNLARLAIVNKEMDALSAESKLLTGEVKERSITEFAKLYESTGKFPGSFHIKATGAKNINDAAMLFIPTDKYLTIDEERYDELKKTYGEDMVEEKDTYTMDTELIEKYGEIISDLIEKCKKISEEDKANLIAVTTKYTVKKGTISDLKKFKKPIEEVLMDAQPVYQMKSVRIED